MPEPETALYRIQSIRSCERRALQSGLTEDELMLRAGQAAFSALLGNYPTVTTIAIFCGSGNNAGDGYILARLAHEQGLSVVVYQCGTKEHLPAAAQRAAMLALSAGVNCLGQEAVHFKGIDIIVDALLGIGIQGQVKESLAEVIQTINESSLPVLAIDLPSGFNADTGNHWGACVRADVTTTFIGKKIGMVTAEGFDQCGKVILDTLQLEEFLPPPDAYELSDGSLSALPQRPKNSHKGMYGRLLVIGGSRGMPGAIALTALAALKTGAGSVTIATAPEYAKGALPFLPEAMIYGIKDGKDLLPLLREATVCVIGPGLGEEPWVKKVFNLVVDARLPLVIDASALRLLASHPRLETHWILTPHPGEAASLLHCTVAEIQKDRFLAAQRIQQQYGGSLVLKGAGSIVQTKTPTPYVCPIGNPGMASAGMGDVLSGVLGGLLAQDLPVADTLKLGVWLHAKAGEDAAKIYGERGLLASDLMPFLRQWVNRHE